MVLGESGGSRWREGFCGRKRRAEVAVEPSLVAWVRLDQRINQGVLCLQKSAIASMRIYSGRHAASIVTMAMDWGELAGRGSAAGESFIRASGKSAESVGEQKASGRQVQYECEQRQAGPKARAGDGEDGGIQAQVGRHRLPVDAYTHVMAAQSRPCVVCACRGLVWAGLAWVESWADGRAAQSLPVRHADALGCKRGRALCSSPPL